MPRCVVCGFEGTSGGRFCPSCGAALVTPTSAPTEVEPREPRTSGGPLRYAPGTMLAGRYRIVSFLGRGGMGEVYRADDLRLGEPVALKFLSRHFAEDQRMRARFDAEVRLARAVAHPNVCRVYDVGEAEGRTFLSMAYVDGEDLATLLRRIGRLPGPKALEIARQLCAGLAAAHAQGVLHRDLKPANVMLDGRGHARITDFGLAVLDAPGEGSDTAGTPAYMAPEILEGHAATVASDIYGLGLVLYEIVTGKAAFEGDSPESWQRAHLSSTPTSPAVHVPDVDAAVERAILRCVEKDPARRPASAASVAAMLPGGDPLAAALAAGETPSPELVAAAGEEGTLSLKAASAWLLLVVAGVAVSAFTSAHYSLFALVPRVPDPPVMRERARDVLRTLGHDAAAVDWVWAYDTVDFAGRIRAMDPSKPTPAISEVGTMRPSPVLFLYRQSPQPLVPSVPGEEITDNDPPMLWSGEAEVGLDPDGRLVVLKVLGPQFDDRPLPSAPTDWSPLFRLADLDPTAFRETDPHWSAMIASTERKAWEGKLGPFDVRIEAEAWRGRPVSFEIKGPWSRRWRMEPWVLPLGRRIAFASVNLLFLGSIVAISFLARRNIRLGRADRKGASRLALLALGMAAVTTALDSTWLADTGALWRFATAGLGWAFFLALATWTYYLGVEPYLRRQAPHRLVAWTRALDGRWRDPMVGREVLIGTGIGAALAAVSCLPWAVGIPLGIHGIDPSPTDPLMGAARFWSRSVLLVVLAIVYAWSAAALFLLLRLVTRSEIIAWLGIAVLVALTTVGLPLPLEYAIPVIAVTAAGMTLALRRGPLCGAAALLGWLLPLTTTFTFQLDRWYAWRGLVVAGILIALAASAWRITFGRRPLLDASLD